MAASSCLLLALLYLVLLIPPRDRSVPGSSERTPFRWDRDAFWSRLESRYEEVRGRDCTALAAEIGAREELVAALLRQLEGEGLASDAVLFDDLESALFELAPWVAACSDHLPGFTRLVTDLRAAVKKRSIDWDIEDPRARERLYRALYGSRAALEEAILQAPPGDVSALVLGRDVASVTPAVTVHGLRVHSGDLLVSRGGAATSALIARANDFPGNFSHVALVHVDPSRGEAVAVEAHIESGVGISTVEQYLNDKKLRILLLRPRPDHPLLVANPMLPHQAAAFVRERVRRERIPYDFRMDFVDPSELFCSEVASHAYEEQGLTLWMGLSHISSPVLRTWLSGFGVEQFETEAPSDLEYDPTLQVVAEWRDPSVLFADHLDNAIIDALAQTTEVAAPLPYRRSLLPLARILKAYSVLRQGLGGVGPVPQGMSASAALRNRAFATRHAALAARLRERADRFTRERGYRPPYWALVRLATELIEEEDR